MNRHDIRTGTSRDTGTPAGLADQRAALAAAHRFWLDGLAASWVPGYLTGRGLHAQIGCARLGYAPAGWTTTADHLRGQGYPEETLLAAGLVFIARSGRMVDVFRDRLIVAVVDADRQLVGFVGRAHPDAGPDKPKYLNSPTTVLFDKGSLLHGLGEDRGRLEHGALPVIVEGPLDRLAIAQVARSVAAVGLAPCGTALTAGQVTALTEIIGPSRPIAVCYDNDPAGQSATLRAWHTLSADGNRRQLLHVQLPVGDPADLVDHDDGDRLRTALLRPRPLALHVADLQISRAGSLDHLAKRYALLEHLIDQDLPRVHPGTVARYLHHLGQRLEIPDLEVTQIAIGRYDA